MLRELHTGAHYERLWYERNYQNHTSPNYTLGIFVIYRKKRQKWCTQSWVHHFSYFSIFSGYIHPDLKNDVPRLGSIIFEAKFGEFLDLRMQHHVQEGHLSNDFLRINIYRNAFFLIFPPPAVREKYIFSVFFRLRRHEITCFSLVEYKIRGHPRSDHRVTGSE